ncbi:2'-5' RNA ligase family protein [Salinimicrobium oceani]|uniref:2'-5' RNA ligase family protein n=1 Tax=Salinimicrobium oceani TaxID=2722702 RepID=A0ABX1CY85_9FLAO|nr:2'-5' RNA ligase family protein [Salinimicrobium oceani]NJW53226.1 2'-5' RNA ligase family protein [Salinimicrobium oceani]
MSFSRALYFTAVLPPAEISKEILDLKLEMKDTYHASHALKLPAHITITPPINLEQSQEEQFKSSIARVAGAHRRWQVEINGLGHFGKRVIFLQVHAQKFFQDLYLDLIAALESYDLKLSKSIHPHITLASKDLRKEFFERAWEDFSSRAFRKIFYAESLCLLKHDGKSWSVLEEFPFQSLE